jgi:quinol monooxygenase YgiN
MISVIAKISLGPGKKNQALESIKKLIQGVATEEGTAYYSVNVDRKNPDTLVFMERYRDMDALKAHGSTPHFQKFMEEAMDFAEGQPEILVMEEIASI